MRKRYDAIRLALFQMSIDDGNLQNNMQKVRQAAISAAKDNVDMLNLPEAADYGWLTQRARKLALPIPGRYSNFLARLAMKYKIWISAGCLERADGKTVYNSAVLINREGKIVLKHRKISTLPRLTKNLYDTGSPKDIKTVDTEFGRVGLTICADNFNIKNPRRVARLGAWLLITPHGFAAKESELKKNSKEYQEHIRKIARKTGLWVVGTNAAESVVKGGAWKGWLHSGSSLVARPDGSIAAIARFREPELLVCDIPKENLHSSIQSEDGI